MKPAHPLGGRPAFRGARPALRSAVLVLLLLYACSGGISRAPAQSAAVHLKTALYWSHAPRAGARLSVKAGHRLSFTLWAFARSRRERIHLSVLGQAPVRLVVRDGNPAKATVVFAPTPGRTGAVAVTFVARSSRGVSITRTIVLSVRPHPTLLSGAHRTRWAYVLQATPARTAPRRTAPIVASLSTATPDQTPNLVVALAKQQAANGREWVKVRLSTLPNNLIAWVPREALSAFRVVATRLVVDTLRLTITLYSHGKRIFAAPVGVGRTSAPTPHGAFYVREKLTDFHNPVYGPVAFGTSARSAVLTDWPGGGVIGIHGTNEPALIPGRISHGCIRLRNADIIRLARLLPLGTPVTVR